MLLNSLKGIRQIATFPSQLFPEACCFFAENVISLSTAPSCSPVQQVKEKVLMASLRAKNGHRERVKI